MERFTPAALANSRTLTPFKPFAANNGTAAAMIFSRQSLSAKHDLLYTRYQLLFKRLIDIIILANTFYANKIFLSTPSQITAFQSSIRRWTRDQCLRKAGI